MVKFQENKGGSYTITGTLDLKDFYSYAVPYREEIFDMDMEGYKKNLLRLTFILELILGELAKDSSAQNIASIIALTETKDGKKNFPINSAAKC